MKFTDGFWMTREGYQIQNPTDIRDIVQKENSVTVYAATKYIRTKGDTLNGTLLKATYSSPMPNVIRVTLNHHKGGVKKGLNLSLTHKKPTLRSQKMNKVLF